MVTTDYPYIVMNENDVPIIKGTRTKVVEIVLDRLAYHWDADEIHRQHPHLGLSQIYNALAYYYDHQKKMDLDIAEMLQQIKEIQTSLGESPIRQKLKTLGHIQ